MKIFGIEIEKQKKKAVSLQKDAYQDSLNKLGEAQFRKLLEKGLRIQLSVS